MNAKIGGSMLLALFLLCSVSAYTTSIHAPAVLQNEYIGTLTVISLNLTAGTGNVTVTGPSEVGSSTLESASVAAAYAASYLGVNEKAYNFGYSIHDPNANVSGPSAGLAFTLLAVSALQGRQLAGNFTVTGTINSNGSVGEIGGVSDKAGAAAGNGMRYMLVPYVQGSSFETEIYYLSQQKYGLPFIEVKNLSAALPYAGLGNNTPEIGKMSINLTADYHATGLTMANIACSACSNAGYFSELVNYTFNFTRSEIYSIGDNFSVAKAQLSSQLSQYEEIAAKGYLYSAADLAFLGYQSASVFANAKYYNMTGAAQYMENVSLYCSSLSPPQMTRNNYEYVIGGELRQGWAAQNLNLSEQLLNASQSTDGIITSVNTAAVSYAWCKAADEMYGIASAMGGAYVAYPSGIKSAALSAINSERAYASGGLYLDSAISAYSQGEYGTALYDTAYASVFDSPTALNQSTRGVVSLTRANIANATYGIWPSEFSKSSLFYLSEASMNGNDSANLTQAYETSLLALRLNAVNKELSGSFVPVNSSTGSQDLYQAILRENQTLSEIQGEISVMSAAMLAVLVAIVVLFVIMLAFFLKYREMSAGVSHGTVQPERKKSRRTGA